MMNDLDLQNMRQKLELERSHLLTRIRDQETKLQSREGANPDALDLAQDYTARERRSVRLAQARSQLELVETALKRLAEGTYGGCTQCGEMIALARLEVLPYALLCVRCQEEQERSAHEGYGASS